jgi:hypothetical protein
MLLGLGGLVPLPPDALVTPVTFRVRKRGLRGILAQFDELEDGKRELSGEWVVTKRLWQRLQAEWKASQTKFRTDSSTPQRKHHNERIILYLHGGQSPHDAFPFRNARLNRTSQEHIICSVRPHIGQ